MTCRDRFTLSYDWSKVSGIMMRKGGQLRDPFQRSEQGSFPANPQRKLQLQLQTEKDHVMQHAKVSIEKY